MKEEVEKMNDANEDGGASRDPPQQWHSRGYLPHRDRIHLLQSITFRLGDSLPESRIKNLEAQVSILPEDSRESHRRKQVAQYLDAGMGCCALRHPEVAHYVQNALLHFDSERYRLLAWCIMPNHVHVLIEPLIPLGHIVRSWKSFTARWILAQNDRLQLALPYGEPIWQREYWDRYIRDEAHLLTAIEYIHQNPVKARLCANAGDWPFSSARAANSSPSARIGA